MGFCPNPLFFILLFQILSMPEYSSFTLIVPTLNEKANIGVLLREIRKLYPGLKIIVSDDGSVDGTKKTVESCRHYGRNLLFLDRSGSSTKGLAASVLDGVAACKTPYFIVMDGDMQHPPEAVDDIIHAFESSNHPDLVVACRASVNGWPAHRRLMSLAASAIGAVSLAVRGRQSDFDVLSGFFGMKKTAFEKLSAARINKSGYKLLFDIAKQLPAQTKISKIYYVFGARGSGKSKIGLKHIVAYLKSTIT